MRKGFWVTGMAALLLLTGCNLGERIPVEMDKVTQDRPVGNESSLEADVHVDVGALEISAENPSKLYSLDLEYDKATYRPDVTYDLGSGNTGRLTCRLESTRRAGIRNQRYTNRLRLDLTDALPVSLIVNTGVGDARLALSHMRLSNLNLESGVGGARISAYDPNPSVCDEIRLRSGVGSLEAVGLGNLNFKRLEFEGGVGGATLDFSGVWKQDADIRIRVGVGGVSVRMPRDVGVRVTAEKHFLSGVQLDGFHREGADGEYYSDNYSKSKVRVTINVATGVGGFRISWI